MADRPRDDLMTAADDPLALVAAAYPQYQVWQGPNNICYATRRGASELEAVDATVFGADPLDLAAKLDEQRRVVAAREVWSLWPMST